MYFFIAGSIVLIDQWVKWWVLENIALYDRIPFLPYLVDLTYIQNTGAAFSMLSGNTSFLALISLVMSLAIGYTLYRKLFSQPLGLWSLSFLLGGAVGNLIDRAFRGYVVDMFDLAFIRFAIFNVADMFVVVGGIGCGLYYLLFYDKYDAPPEEETQVAKALPEKESE